MNEEVSRIKNVKNYRFRKIIVTFAFGIIQNQTVS